MAAIMARLNGYVHYTVAATPVCLGYTVSRDAQGRLWLNRFNFDRTVATVEAVSEVWWLKRRIELWWWASYTEAIGKPFQAADGQWTQIARVHPWRPRYWRDVWRRHEPWYARVIFLVRALWKGR